MEDPDRTASLMTPAKLAQVKPKAPLNPAAWLDQMASDAGHQHVKRLGELVTELRAQAQRRDFQPVATDLARVAEALPQLDFGLLQSKGVLARFSGKNKSSGAEFARQFEKLEASVKSLAGQAKTLQARQGEQVSGTDLALLELEVEFRAIEKIIDQGARWLQDMRTQLKDRDTEAGADEALRAQVGEDAARCEILVARLKTLRTLSSAAQQAHQQAVAAAARRAGLVEVLQKALGSEVKNWRARLEPLAAAAGEGRTPALSLEVPMESHRDLQLGIKQAIADCGQLQAHEKALAESVEVLASHLQAGASAG